MLNKKFFEIGQMVCKI